MTNTNEVTLSGADLQSVQGINAKVPGWSDSRQYGFFKAVMQLAAPGSRFLMLGVYHGRDIAYMLRCASVYRPGVAFEFLGVDKFNAEPCADWPEEKRKLTWQAAGMGAPPSLDDAERNLELFIRQTYGACNVQLLQMDDEAFLATPPRGLFDLAYLDTAHDEPTVARQLVQVLPWMKDDGAIAGDDYSDAGTWGVKRAVAKGTRSHSTFASWIWYTQKSAVLCPTNPAAS